MQFAYKIIRSIAMMTMKVVGSSNLKLITPVKPLILNWIRGFSMHMSFRMSPGFPKSLLLF
jgi:hypothetical protein